jgi:hypothetical protein
MARRGPDQTAVLEAAAPAIAEQLATIRSSASETERLG